MSSSAEPRAEWLAIALKPVLTRLRRRLRRMALAQFLTHRKVKAVSQQIDALAASIARLEAAVATNADDVKALVTSHADRTAAHADDNAAVDALASRVDAVTKVVLASNDTASAATTAATDHPTPQADGTDDDTLARNIAGADTLAGGDSIPGGQDTVEASGQTIDPDTGLPVAPAA